MLLLLLLISTYLIIVLEIRIDIKILSCIQRKVIQTVNFLKIPFRW